MQQAKSEPLEPTRLDPIQYLRALAALMVVWHHATEQIPAAHQWFPWTGGTTGVDIFFVISGFIMVVSTSGRNVTPAQFLWRRVIRVVPLYWITTLAMVAAWWVAPSSFRTLQVTGDTLLKSLSFIPHYSNSFPTKVWPLLVPGWTLNYEMFFYVVFAVALLLPVRFRGTGVVALLVALTASGVVFGPFGAASLSVYTNPMLLEFAAGMLVAGWWLNGRLSWSSWSAWTALLVGGVLLAFREELAFGAWWSIAGALLVVAGATSRQGDGIRSPLLRQLGDASYSIYLTHLFALGVLRKAWQLVPAYIGDSLWGVAAFMLFSLLASSALGLLCYRFLEAPLTAWLRQLGTRYGATVG